MSMAFDNRSLASVRVCKLFVVLQHVISAVFFFGACGFGSGFAAESGTVAIGWAAILASFSRVVAIVLLYVHCAFSKPFHGDMQIAPPFFKTCHSMPFKIISMPWRTFSIADCLINTRLTPFEKLVWEQSVSRGLAGHHTFTVLSCCTRNHWNHWTAHSMHSSGPYGGKQDLFRLKKLLNLRLFALQGLEDIVPIDYQKVQPQPEGFDLVKQPSKSNFGQ